MKNLRNFEKNPIAHAYDKNEDLFDGDCPPEQLALRFAYERLKMLGELPEIEN